MTSNKKVVWETEGSESELPLLRKSQETELEEPNSLKDEYKTILEVNPNVKKEDRKGFLKKLFSSKTITDTKKNDTTTTSNTANTHVKHPKPKVPRPPENEVQESLSILSALFPTTPTNTIEFWLRKVVDSSFE